MRGNDRSVNPDDRLVRLSDVVEAVEAEYADLSLDSGPKWDYFWERVARRLESPLNDDDPAG